MVSFGRIKYILKAWSHGKSESQYFKDQLKSYKEWFDRTTKQERDAEWVKQVYGNSKPLKPSGKIIKYIKFGGKNDNQTNSRSKTTKEESD